MGNITFLVSNDRLTKGTMLIRRPVLKHLSVDTNIGRLNGTDCSEVGNPPITGAGRDESRVMSTRFAGEENINSETVTKTRVNCFENKM